MNQKHFIIVPIIAQGSGSIILHETYQRAGFIAPKHNFLTISLEKFYYNGSELSIPGCWESLTL
jgi:hypothetical protein